MEASNSLVLQWGQELLKLHNTIGHSLMSLSVAYGDSQQSASHNTWDKPVAGISQGNGAGLPIWAAVSSPMFDVMRQEGFYTLLMGSISHQQQKVAGFAFVDNTNLCITHQSNKVEHVVAQMQKAITHWEGLLWVTGGVLVPEKCFWYLVKFKHTNNKWSYKKCNQLPSSISLLDTDHQQVSIQRLEPLEARQTLGVWSTFSPQWQYGN